MASGSDKKLVPASGALHDVPGEKGKESNRKKLDKKGNRGWNECTVDHGRLIPVNEFKISDLPPECQNKGTFETIKHMADLTVKLTVNRVSNARPQTDPFSKYKGDKITRTGTGKVIAVHFLATPKKMFVHISTDNHVVFDDDEAMKTQIEFFYDDETNKEKIVKLQGGRLIERNPEKDRCVLVCEVDDFKLAEKLKTICDRFNKGVELLKGPNNVGVEVSHPHGVSKQIKIKKFPPPEFLSRGDMAIYTLRGRQMFNVDRYEKDSAKGGACEISSLDMKVKFPDLSEKICRLTLLAHTMDENLGWILFGEGVATPRELIQMIWEDPDSVDTPIDRTKTLEYYMDLFTFNGTLKLELIADPVRPVKHSQLVGGVQHLRFADNFDGAQA